jgi:hypothetical protein
LSVRSDRPPIRLCRLNYIPSKIHLLYAVVEPRQKDAFARLEKRVLKVKSPRDRLRAILLGIWRDIPMENIGLTNSLILMTMLNTLLPDADARQIDYDVLPNFFMMAYDGFVINRRLNDLRDIERRCNAACDIILGPSRR